MDVDQMLEQRYSLYLEWADPWEALDAELGAFTACVSHRATVHHCIGIARHYIASKGHPQPSDEDALLEFIAIMWAEPVPPSPDTDVKCYDSPRGNQPLP